MLRRCALLRLADSLPKAFFKEGAFGMEAWGLQTFGLIPFVNEYILGTRREAH